MGHCLIKENYKNKSELLGYMCGVDFLYHLGNDINGAVVYPSIQDLYAHMKYPSETEYPQDGIVRVVVEFKEHIAAENCWSAKTEEEKREKLIEDQTNREGHLRVGDSVMRADFLIGLLKSKGFL